jgi:hypothetical protein
MKLTAENRSTRRKTCHSATLSTTNSTWTDPGSNPGLRGGRLAANRLSHGTAQDYNRTCCFVRACKLFFTLTEKQSESVPEYSAGDHSWSKRDEATGNCRIRSWWIRLVTNIVSVTKSRRMKLARHVARVEKANAYRVLVCKHDGRRDDL